MNTAKKPEDRRFSHERQPLLPLTDVAREQNRRDAERETEIPEQLDLLAPVQHKLFE